MKHKENEHAVTRSPVESAYAAWKADWWEYGKSREQLIQVISPICGVPVEQLNKKNDVILKFIAKSIIAGDLEYAVKLANEVMTPGRS